MRSRARVALAGAALVVVSILVVAWSGSAAARPRVAAPDPSRLGAVGPRFRDRILAGPLRTLAAAGRRASFWGGAITASDGEALTIYMSDYYGQDETARRVWADFVVRLYHGPELGRVSILIAPLAEIQTICGTGAGGCYSPAAEALVAPGEDLPDGTSKETVIVHELGHNVAANRDNAPWDAIDWGAKRWASYMNVCSREVTGTAFPGDEAERYFLNPGEAFAESYRLLNFQLLALTTLIWNADPSFFPDQAALDAVKEDVLTPWAGDSTTTWSGRLVAPAPPKPPVVKKKQASRSKPKVEAKRRRTAASTPVLHSIDTPRDGDLLVTLDEAPAGTRLSLLDAAGNQLVGPTAGSLRFTLCGQRSVSLAVAGSASGPFTVSVSEP